MQGTQHSPGRYQQHYWLKTVLPPVSGIEIQNNWINIKIIELKIRKSLEIKGKLNNNYKNRSG